MGTFLSSIRSVLAAFTVLIAVFYILSTESFFGSRQSVWNTTANGAALPTPPTDEAASILDSEPVTATESSDGSFADAFGGRTTASLHFYNRKFDETVYQHPVFVQKHCKEGAVELLILVNSLASDFDMRMAIRDTWGLPGNFSNEPGPANETAIVFVIGENETIDSSEVARLKAESHEHGDLLISSIREDYYNLTLKTYLMLKWTSSQCPGVKCMLKTDHDVIVFRENLREFCRSKTQTSASQIYGHCWNRAAVGRDPKKPKSYVPTTDYAPKFWPTYCSGTGYLLTGKAPQKLVAAAPKHRWLWVEDTLFTGIIAAAAKVPRILNWNFAFTKETKYDPCRVKGRLTSHGFKSGAEIKRAWRNLELEKTMPCVPKNVTAKPVKKQKKLLLKKL